MRKLELQNNLQKILDKVKGGQNARLLAVSKTKPASDIELLYEIGQRDFGENKVQELLDKATELNSTCPDISWHFIGKLQSNKVNMLLKVPNLKAIQSIDSLNLLEKLISKNPKNKIGLFLQVNTSQESEKSGFENTSDLEKAIYLILKSDSFFLQGLMTIGKIRTDNFVEDAKKSFSTLCELKKSFDNKFNLNLELSMGMSSDYELALTYGTNWIRLGSSIFGSRS